MLELHLAIPNDLPFRPIDVCPRWEVNEFFDENDRLISQLMPPSYKSRSFEIFYFAKIKVAHDTVFGEAAYSEPIMLRMEQCVEQRIHVKRISDDFDDIDFAGTESSKNAFAKKEFVETSLLKPLVDDNKSKEMKNRQSDHFIVAKPCKYFV